MSISKKRRREQATADTQLIEIFEDLANNDPEIRLKAAQLLLGKFAPENHPTQEQLDKTLKRLIRGLCSGRKSARLGFSVALTELLAQHAQHDAGLSDTAAYNVPDVIKQLKELTKTAGASSGQVSDIDGLTIATADNQQEDRDHAFGRLFGSEALIKSKVLFMDAASCENWATILDFIYELAQKKIWLREECGWVLFNSVQVLKTINNGATSARVLIDKAQSNNLVRTPEGVALWVACQHAFPDLKMPKHVYYHGDPLHKKEKSTLARILKHSSPGEESTKVNEVDASKKVAKSSSGHWSTKLHFSWDVILRSLLQPNPEHCTFDDVWKEAVDEGLFAISSSPERKYWGFLLVQLYVSNGPEKVLPVIFGKNFGRSLINHLAAKDRNLHTIADKTLKAMLSRAIVGATVPIVNAMLDIDPSFDKLTKSKSLEKVLTDTGLQALQVIVPKLTSLLAHKKSGDGQQSKPMVSQNIADLLIAVVRSRSVPDGKDLVAWREIVCEILRSLSSQAYAEGTKEREAEMFQSRITSCLTHTIVKDHSDPTFIPYMTICSIRELPGAAPKAEPKVLDIIENGWATLEKLQTKGNSAKGSRKQTFVALKLLYIFTLLQIYNGDADAVSLIEELQGCYKNLTKRNVSDDADSGGEVLVEILLSFISKPSLLFRRLASQIFSACTKAVNESAIDSMTEILRAKENAAGQEALFDKDMDEEMMEEMDQDVEMVDEDASDIEVVSDEDDAEAESGSASNGESDPDGDGDEDEDADELAAFDAKLAQALGTRRADDDLATQNEESSDEDMNDEEMEALDSHLINMFKERKVLESKKKDKKDAKDSMVLFKSRILELLEIYAKQETTNPLALAMVVPLLDLIHDTTSKQVSEKAQSLIRTFAKSYRFSGISKQGDNEALAIARGLLEEVHSHAGKEGPNAYGIACSQAHLLAVKAVLVSGGSVDEIIAALGATQGSFLTDKDCRVRPGFFADFQNWMSQARQTILKSTV
jgi:DNA polymerase phi